MLRSGQRRFSVLSGLVCERHVFFRNRSRRPFLWRAFFISPTSITGIMVKPDGRLSSNGLSDPPDERRSFEIGDLIGVVGTTIAPWMQFNLQRLSSRKADPRSGL